MAPPRRARSALIFSVLCSAAVLGTPDQFMVNAALAQIVRSLRTSLSPATWTLKGNSIAFAALLVPAGRFADRSGHKRSFLAGMAVFTAASALCAWSHTIDLLIVGRVSQAAGAAVMLPSSLALLLDGRSDQKRRSVLGAWGAATGIAAGVAPVFGGWLTAINWRWIFLGNVPIGLAAIGLGVAHLPRATRDQGPMPDVIGAALISAAVGFLALSLVEAPAKGWESSTCIGALAASFIAFGIFVRRSSQHPRPLIEPALLRVRAFVISSAASVIYCAAFAGMLLSITLFLQDVWHFSPLHAGLAFAPGPLIVPMVALASGRITRWIGDGPTAAVGCGLLAAALALWATRVEGPASYTTAMLPGLLLAGAGIGLTLSTLVAAGSASLPSQRLGTGSATLTMARQFGFTLGVAVTVAVLGTSHEARFDRAWIVVALIALLGAATSLLLATQSTAVPAAQVATDSAR